jgi:hypothetical protein
MLKAKLDGFVMYWPFWRILADSNVYWLVTRKMRGVGMRRAWPTKWNKII